MKIKTLSSTHKKYIKKYGSKKAAEKFNLNLTKAKSYEKKYKGSSYQGKRTLGSKSNDSDSEIFADEGNSGVNSMGTALGVTPGDLSGMPQMGMPGMPQMGMPGMAPPAMPQMEMPGMAPPAMSHMGMEQMAMSPMSPVSQGALNFDPSQNGIQGMPQMGMPGMPQMGMPGMPQMGMPQMGMPGMFQGQEIDMKKVDPLMVEVSAPVNKFNGNMAQYKALPDFQSNLQQTAGGLTVAGIDLSKLSFFK